MYIIPCLLLIITLRFTCGEIKIWSNIKKFQNIIIMIAGWYSSSFIALFYFFFLCVCVCCFSLSSLPIGVKFAWLYLLTEITKYYLAFYLIALMIGNSETEATHEFEINSEATLIFPALPSKCTQTSFSFWYWQYHLNGRWTHGKGRYKNAIPRLKPGCPNRIRCYPWGPWKKLPFE